MSSAALSAGAGAEVSAPRGALAWVPAWALTAVLGLAYVIAAPPAPDLAAASYRSWLLSTSGFTLWDNGWYGGHHLPAYSLLAPALGALVGPRLLAAASMALATALFTAVIRGRFPHRSVRIASWWFAVGASIALLSCRVPFDLGLALALGALLLAQRGRLLLAGALAALAAVASPVAGAFLALALVTWGLLAPGRRRALAALTLAVLVPVGALVLVFPEGGSQPFVASAFYPALAGVIAIALLIGRAEPELRLGAWLYALAMTASYLVPSAMGGNADRLGALAAGPVAACALAGHPDRRRRVALAVLAPFLLYWQANAPVADFSNAVSDPAVNESYYAPLLSELRALHVGYDATPARVEVVPSADHWEARWVAPATMIARGWERQLDRYRNGVFYGGGSPLDAAGYRAWLSQQAIAYVALPDSRLDYSARAEAALLRSGPPYLREVWSSEHWRLFAVRDPTPLAAPPAELTRVGHDSFTLRAPRAGSYLVRIRFTPYWALGSGRGCVSQARGGFTDVRVGGPETVTVTIAFSLGRVFGHGARCR
ncbi:MAG TPA: hypothetical protein VFW29_08840 [Solirubrobacteraceae bacterium]|nr:hypothetical protein [Solirubrobacteraceae bacterium]